MHIKSLKITNFRKFGNSDNEIEFVASSIPSAASINTVASSTTLIVGKNNAGKTTVAKALQKLISHNISARDFNFTYLQLLLEQYKAKNFSSFPTITFNVVVSISTESDDLLTNVGHFIEMQSGDTEDAFIDLNITMTYELSEIAIFETEVEHVLAKYQDKEIRFIFRKFLSLIDESKFKVNYFNSSGAIVDGAKFKISDLISLKLISAEKKLNDPSLSKTFSGLISARYKLPSKLGARNTLDSMIDQINSQITTSIDSDGKEINDVLHIIESQERIGIELSSDLDIDQMLANIVRYEYSEQDQLIPEGQFGLGYANLMNIISEIIGYVDEYPDEERHSRINIICIEEPENYMHPQMQESFINRIDKAVKLLLESSGKTINSQLVITTHSSHILNSKIHASNSFDSINYITSTNNYSHVVKLNDKSVVDVTAIAKGTEAEVEKQRLNQLKFLKKHIKFKVSDLFFSDAVIIVEGSTEETLLPYYLELNKELQNYHISIFNINGAHGKVYYPLIKLLKVPTLLVTDIDIKRTEAEREKCVQVVNLKDRTTTNSTLVSFNSEDSSLSTVLDYFEMANLKCIFQLHPINEQHATSFEEALILDNYDNSVLNNVLKKLKPDIYAEIVGPEESMNRKNLVSNSYKLQQKLSKSKSDFANSLLYDMITAEVGEELPTMPQYISDGFKWLKKALSSSTVVKDIVNLEEAQ